MRLPCRGVFCDHETHACAIISLDLLFVLRRNCCGLRVSAQEYSCERSGQLCGDREGNFDAGEFCGDSFGASTNYYRAKLARAGERPQSGPFLIGVR